MSAIVSFVSAGPGDPELLTVKAVERLQVPMPCSMTISAQGRSSATFALARTW